MFFSSARTRSRGKMEKHFAAQKKPFQNHDFEKRRMQNKAFLCNTGGGKRTTQSKSFVPNPTYFEGKKATYPELIIHSWWVLFNKSTIIRSDISVVRILLQHVDFLFDLFLFILG